MFTRPTLTDGPVYVSQRTGFSPPDRLVVSPILPPDIPVPFFPLCPCTPLFRFVIGVPLCRHDSQSHAVNLQDWQQILQIENERAYLEIKKEKKKRKKYLPR